MKPFPRKIMILAVLFLVCMPIRIWASDNGQLDAVLVIDASGSMQETDPNKLGLEGVKLFIDMMAATGNQVGIVTYGSQVDTVYPMTVVNSQDEKEKIKSFVDGLTRDLEYTDITAGLGKALDMQENRDTSLGNKPLIIIFTDGNNAIAGVTGRDYEMIDKDLAKMIEKAKNVGYPIYTIGLNDNGKLNEDYLRNISSETSALAFATKDPTELPDILTQIFAAHSNLKVQSLGEFTSTGDFEEIKVNIPNNNVLEANISATSNEALSFKLVDPSGNTKIIPSGDVTLHESQSYHLLKISRPIEGDWKLYVKGVAGDQINIDLVYNYDIEVTMEPLKQNSFGKGETLEVVGYLSVEGNPIDDDALYQSSKATLIIKEKSTGAETHTNMQVNGHQFEASYELLQEGEYEVSIFVEDTSYQRESQSITIMVGTKVGGYIEDEEDGVSPLIFVIIAIGVVIAGVIGFIGTRIIQDINRPLVGQIVIELRDHTTGKLTPPQYKKLNVFKGKVSLHALLQFAPELQAAEKIIFKAASGDKVILINTSDYSIEKAGRIVKAESGIELKKGDKLSINMADSGQTVQIEYLL